MHTIIRVCSITNKLSLIIMALKIEAKNVNVSIEPPLTSGVSHIPEHVQAVALFKQFLYLAGLDGRFYVRCSSAQKGSKAKRQTVRFILHEPPTTSRPTLEVVFQCDSDNSCFEGVLSSPDNHVMNVFAALRRAYPDQIFAFVPKNNTQQAAPTEGYTDEEIQTGWDLFTPNGKLALSSFMQTLCEDAADDAHAFVTGGRIKEIARDMFPNISFEGGCNIVYVLARHGFIDAFDAHARPSSARRFFVTPAAFKSIGAAHPDDDETRASSEPTSDTIPAPAPVVVGSDNRESCSTDTAAPKPEAFTTAPVCTDMRSNPASQQLAEFSRIIHMGKAYMRISETINEAKARHSSLQAQHDQAAAELARLTTELAKVSQDLESANAVLHDAAYQQAADLLKQLPKV